MYVENYPILASDIATGEDIFARFEQWPSNGTYVRFPDGRRFDRVSTKEKRIHYLVGTNQSTHIGFITDALLVSRIVEYMEHYYGTKHTNCSAFAHFLTTGRFIECDPELQYLVLEQGMCVYDSQKIGVGDMICILYSSKRQARSRKSTLRTGYMKVQKERHNDGRFGHSIATKHTTFTAAQIHDLRGDYRVEDYHFMVCAAIHNGEPVWVSQRGRFVPGEVPVPIVLTVGLHDCYDPDVPILTLIKKRR